MKASKKIAPEQNRWDQARAACLEMLDMNPDHVPALHFMGGIEYKAGHLKTAAAYLEKAQNLSPASPEIRTNYAMVLIAQKKMEPAIAQLRAALALNPAFTDAHYLLGNALKAFGRDNRRKDCLFEAIGHYKQTLKLNPAHPGAYNNWGVTCLDLSHLKEAAQCFEKATALSPQDPEPLNNLGITYRLQSDPDQSAFYCRQALALRPAYPAALNNLGNALKDRDDLAGARAAYEQAIALAPTDPAFQCNLAMVLLALGHFKEGWETYESRKKTFELKFAQPVLTQPQWTGQEAAGQTLLIYAEQGFGDTLQFCRYASLAADRGLRVILDVPPALARLMQTVRGVDQVVTGDDDLPPFDWVCPMMSLPLALGMDSLAAIPSAPAYLTATQAATEKWQQRIQDENIQGLKVGLVWAGQARKQSADLTFTDQKRSMSPAHLQPLKNMKGVQFFNLHKNGVIAPAGFTMIQWMDDCDDFADTAGLIMNLDLVITVDTAAAHLAGALGKPVWVLNRFAGCWRWLRGRDDSPWYPSLRLFTQESAGDWPGVIARVKQELESLLMHGGR